MSSGLKLGHCFTCPAPLCIVYHNCRLLKLHHSTNRAGRVTVAVDVHPAQCTIQTRLLTDDEGAARATVQEKSRLGHYILTG